MTRRRFTQEQRDAILRAAECPGVTVAAVCREYGITATVFYRWRAKYGRPDGAGSQRQWELEQENARLKRLLAERDLEVDALRQRLSGRP
jgi:putative transposase